MYDLIVTIQKKSSFSQISQHQIKVAYKLVKTYKPI